MKHLFGKREKPASFFFLRLSKKIVWGTLLLAFLPLSRVQAANSNVKYNFHNQSISYNTLFSLVEEQSGFSLFFRDTQLNLNQRIELNLENASIEEVLTEALQNENLSFKIDNKLIVIYPNPNHQKQSSTSKTKVFDSVGKSIKGKVTDQAGIPLPGVSVVVKGTTVGTVTDMNGQYTLDHIPTQGTLTFSFIGMESIEKSVAGVDQISVIMKNAAVGLNEVVAVGFGSQKKANLTGAVASVEMDELEKRPVVSVSAGLQGMSAGITVTQGSGQPGADGGTIRIRGVGTLNNSNPLVLIDGIESSLDNLDPNEIGSISVLKDAASAAIYGSKAANGVILVTTKRGKAGKVHVNYNMTVGVQTPTELPDYLHSWEYADLYNEALINDGKAPRFNADEIELFKSGKDPYKYPDTDWQGLLYIGSGIQQIHNLSISGGNEKTRYMTTIGYQRQKGIIDHTQRRQFNVRSNIDINPSEKFHIVANMSYLNRFVQEPTNPYVGGSSQIFRLVNRIAPWIPYKNEDGTYGAIADGNPIAWMDLNATTDKQYHRFMGIGSIDYKILPELSLKVQGSYRFDYEDSNEFRKDIWYTEDFYQGPNKMFQWCNSTIMPTGDIILNYDNQVGNNHITGMAGFHSEYYAFKQTYAFRQNFPNNEVTDMNAGSTDGMANSGYQTDVSMLSWFGRVNYDYKSKYLAEVNLRADASSRFAKGNRWGYFPSFSLGWRASEENFMKSIQWITSLKLRGSWGLLGNQNLGDSYPAETTLNAGLNYPFNDAISQGVGTTSIKNKEISWEDSQTWGLGVDLSVGRDWSFVIDYYDRLTKGILMQVAAPATFGTGGYYDNVGRMRNRGIEFTANYHKQLGALSLNIGGNFSYNKNKILNLGEDEFIYDGDRKIRKVGEKLNSFYGYETDGLFRSQEELDKWPKYQMSGKPVQLGDLKYVDQNGDGIVNDKDRVVFDSSDPDITFAFNFNLLWKGFDLSAQFQGAAMVKGYLENEAIGVFLGDGGHPSTLWRDRYHPTKNPKGTVPRLSSDIGISEAQIVTSDYWLQNANYLRLKNLQVGYTLPKEWSQKLHTSKIRFYYTGQNIATITKFMKGWDPEVPSGNGSNYPVVEVNSFGMNVSL